MIASRWRNVATVITSVVLMLFAMVKVILALALNLSSESWVSIPSNFLQAPETTRLITGISILLDSVFVFPAAWTGICAAVSRHRGVYIASLVISSLAFLGTTGGVVAIGWQFGIFRLFKDSGSSNDELAILLMTLQSVVVVILLILMAFETVALIFKSPYDSKSRNGKLLPKPTMREESYKNPYSFPVAPRPASVAAGASPYRPLTQGSPEWDKFYEQFYNDYNRGGYGGQVSRKERSRSFRY